MKAVPLFQRILVQVVDRDETTPGGIIIPDAAKEKPTEAIVKSIGDKVQYVAVGDRVLFSKYAGNEIVINNENFLVLHEEDVQVRLEEV